MDTKNIDDLHADPRNPRTMSDHDGNALKESINKFGDLSCIVFNIRTQQLVGGHQRLAIMKQLPAERRVMLTEKFENPDEVGTVAIGYVYIGNKQFAYREVDWDENTQHAANIAANRIQGEFNLDMLAELNYELNEGSPDLLALTGQTDKEITQLLSMVTGEPGIDLPDGEKEGFQQMTFTLSDEQVLLVAEALAYAKKHKPVSGGTNENSNGNALYAVARDFLEDEHSKAN